MILTLIWPLIGDPLHEEPTTKPSCHGFNIQHCNSIHFINSFIATNLVELSNSDVRTKNYMM